MTASRIATTNAPAAVGPYSQAVSTGEGSGAIVHVSGQVPLDPTTGALVDGGVRAQAERVLTSIGAILEAAGLGYDDVVKTTVLLTDIADFAAVNDVYARFFTAPVLPARAAFAAGCGRRDRGGRRPPLSPRPASPAADRGGAPPLPARVHCPGSSPPVLPSSEPS